MTDTSDKTMQQRVVGQARTWLGTKFHHQGRIKRTAMHTGGCDCLGLLVGVARELGIQARQSRQPLTNYDEQNYGHRPDSERLQRVLATLLQPIVQEDMQAGDVVLMAFDDHPQHLGILTDYVAGGLGLIHAYAAARQVVEHRLDKEWGNRIRAAYRILA